MNRKDDGMSTTQARCESGGCVRTRTVGDVTQVWDTGRPDVVLEVPTAAWEAHEAALRVEGWAEAISALLDGERVSAWFTARVQESLTRTGVHPWPPNEWAPREEYAAYLTEVRDEEKEDGDGR